MGEIVEGKEGWILFRQKKTGSQEGNASFEVERKRVECLLTLHFVMGVCVGVK